MGRMKTHRWWWSPEFLAAIMGGLLAELISPVIGHFSGYALPAWVALALILVAVILAYYLGKRNQIPGTPVASFPSERSTIALTHRHTEARQQYYQRAFLEGEEILYVTIMSESTLKTDGVEGLLKTLKPNAKIRVLTWYSRHTEVIEAFRAHICENKQATEKTVTQLYESLNEWRGLKREFPSLNFSVKVYESSPTMQGVLVRNGWALIEPLPYNTGTAARPGFILTPAEAPKTLALLWDKFNDLFENGAKLLTDDWPLQRSQPRRS
jgi:hypothetical protein